MKKKSSFHSQSHPLHSILSPILRPNPISPTNLNIFPQHSTLTIHPKRFHQKKGRMIKSVFGGKKENGDKNIREGIKERKIKSEDNNRSKVKKHLIESIDFREIQKKLYKKRDWITWYEYFSTQLQQKKQFQSIGGQIESSARRRKEVRPEIFMDNRTLNVRQRPKKKFWIRQRREKGKIDEKGCLQGTSLKNAEESREVGQK